MASYAEDEIAYLKQLLKLSVFYIEEYDCWGHKDEEEKQNKLLRLIKEAREGPSEPTP